MRARDNLLREHVPNQAIRVTGNTVVEALHMAATKCCDLVPEPMASVPWERRILLVTAHRRENIGQPLEGICKALRELARRYPDDLHIVFPVHPNPAVQKPVYSILGGVPGITLTDPLDYQPFVNLLSRCFLVLTDSGGLQEEAPSLRKPVLVLRSATERPEGVDSGAVKLVGTTPQRIVDEAARLLDDPEAYHAMAKATNPYGDGRAASRIVEALLDDGNPPATDQPDNSLVGYEANSQGHTINPHWQRSKQGDLVDR
jgi:UDP-N-acetylglucosamine 2-epimerase (non-hydrolysing)